MFRRLMVILATTASIGLTAAAAPVALAGSHWSSNKCSNEYEAWRKHNLAHKKTSNKQRTKEAEAEFTKIDKKHGCHLGFGRN